MAKTAFDLSRFSGFRADPDELIIIGLDTEDGSEHPLWDGRVELPVDPGFVLNLGAFGVIEPIVITKASGKIKGQVVDNLTCVVAGRQRVKGCREWNKLKKSQGLPNECIEVPCVHRANMDPATALGVAASENEWRTAETLEERVARAKRLQALGRSLAEIAVIFHVSPESLKNWLALDSEPTVKEAVANGEISASDGYKLAKKLAKVTSPEEKQARVSMLANRRKVGKTGGSFVVYLEKSGEEVLLKVGNHEEGDRTIGVWYQKLPFRLDKGDRRKWRVKFEELVDE